MLRLLVALECEAKPLREHWRLQPHPARGFRVYGNADTRLVVSGPGVLNAAAATAYLAGLDGPEVGAAWLNVGMAGHGRLAPGTPLLAHSIRGESGAWYPPLAFPPPCGLGKVLSVATPETVYTGDSAYEMEAAGFYPSACRFAGSELVQVLKIVSDNPGNPASQLDAARVSALMAGALPVVEQVCEALRELATTVAMLDADPPGYRECLTRWHFSVSQRQRLHRLLARYRLLRGEAPRLPGVTTGRAVLRWLETELDSLPPQLSNGPPS